MSKDTSGAPKAGKVPAMPSMKKGFKGLVQDLGREMKNVTWPTPQEATRLSGVVLALCATIVIILFGLSFFFEVILKVVGGGR